MAKLISELDVGDIIFIVRGPDWTFDFGEIIEKSEFILRFQCYFEGIRRYIWTYDESVHEMGNYYIFTDEIEALNWFKSKLWQE